MTESSDSLEWMSPFIFRGADENPWADLNSFIWNNKWNKAPEFFLKQVYILIYQLVSKLTIKKLWENRELITQLGEFSEGPSHPICATCLTSVGWPILISGCFSLLSTK